MVIADIVGSRDLGHPERARVQERVLALAGSNVAFRVSGGDEFEWVLPDAPASLDEVLRFRLDLGASTQGVPGVGLRIGLGRGEIFIDAPNPYGGDGPAYHRARQAMDALRDERSTRRSTAHPLRPGRIPPRRTALVDGQPSPLRDALLTHMDQLMLQWSPSQWEALALVSRGRSYAQAAATLGISSQAVHKRLSAASWDQYLVGHQALKAAWEEP